MYLNIMSKNILDTDIPNDEDKKSMARVVVENPLYMQKLVDLKM